MCPATIKRWGHRLRDFANRHHICADAAEAVRRFAGVISFDEAIWPLLRSELAGKDLACWCRLCDRHRDGKPLDENCPDCAPCHVDPLGKIANSPLGDAGCRS